MLIDSWQAVFKKSGLHSQAGENPELRAFFYQLCEFSKAPITLVFVFDGPGRPSIKRGKKVKTKPLWLIEHVKKVIKAFGYYFHMVCSFPDLSNQSLTNRRLQVKQRLNWHK